MNNAAKTGRDRRMAPRIQGGIQLAYRITGSGPEAWFEPDPWMDFSLTGLRFADVDRLKAGDRVSLRMRVPTVDLELVAKAEVVRVRPLSPNEQQTADLPDAELATSEVALAFVEISPVAVAALAQFTERIQDAALSKHRLLQEIAV